MDKKVLVSDLVKILIDPLVLVLLFLAIGAGVLFRRGRDRIGLFLFAFVFFFLYIFSMPLTANTMLYFLEKDYFVRNIPDKLDIIVLLGGGISDGYLTKETLPSRQTAARVLNAVQIYRKRNPDYIICSGGGQGRLKEAEVIRNAIERLGVPKSRIRLEPNSENTRQHAENLSRMIPQRDLTIGLVTSAYHMKRSEWEFKKYFPGTIPLATDFLFSSSNSYSWHTFIPSSEALYIIRTAIRELTGLGWYLMRNP